MRHLVVIAMCIICYGMGFCFGVEHEAKKDMFAQPMYTSRVVINYGLDKAILFTAARCDSLGAKDDGWWANRYIQDPKSTVVVENMEWPYSDACK